MRLPWFLVLVVTLTAVYDNFVNADDIDHANNTSVGQIHLHPKDTGSTSRKRRNAVDEERGVSFGIGKLKTLFQKFPVLNKYKDQIGKGSDLNKMKTAAMKDPEIVKLKNTVGKIQLTNQDATKVRSFASKHPQIANILFSTIIILAAFGILGVLPATLIALAITPHQ